MISQEKGLSKTHDCFVLAKKVSAPQEILGKTDSISPYYFRTRYPDVEEVKLNIDDIERIHKNSLEVTSMAEEGGKKKDDRREKGVFPSMDKKAILENIKSKLSENIDIERVFLFGSRARGDHDEDSDYDLAIISPDFEKISFDERQKLVRPIIREILSDEPIEAICYTPQEYKKGKSAFLPYMIEKEGISV